MLSLRTKALGMFIEIEAQKRGEEERRIASELLIKKMRFADAVNAGTGLLPLPEDIYEATTLRGDSILYTVLDDVAVGERETTGDYGIVLFPVNPKTAEVYFDGSSMEDYKPLSLAWIGAWVDYVLKSLSNTHIYSWVPGGEKIGE